MKYKLEVVYSDWAQVKGTTFGMIRPCKQAKFFFLQKDLWKSSVTSSKVT